MQRCILSTQIALLAINLPMTVWAQTGTTFPDAMEKASKARLAGDFAASERALIEALQVFPDDPQALRQLALMQAFQDKLKDALNTIARAATQAPDDIDVRLTQARIVGWNDNFTRAESLVDQVINQAPDYADAWTLKGRLAYYQGDFPRALRAFDRAQALQPDSLEAFLGTGDVLRAQGKFENARDQYERAAALYPEDNEVQLRLSQPIENPGNLWRIDIDGEFSSLSRTPLGDWNQQNARIERMLSDRTRIMGGLERADRFGLSDWSFTLGGSHRFTDISGGYLEVTVGADVDFVPDWAVASGADVRLWKGSGIFNAGVATLDARVRGYSVGTVYSFDAGWQQYVFDGRAWVWGKVLNTIDPGGKHVVGWSLAGYAQVTDNLGIRVAGAIAPESDRGIVTNTNSIAAGLSYELSDHLTLNISGSRDSRDNSYVRHSIRSGLSLKF